MLQTLAAGVPRVQQMWSRVAWIDLDARWAVVISARVTLYGGQEPATSTFSLRGCNPQRAGACSGGRDFGSEWGGRWQTIFNKHTVAPRTNSSWSQEWLFGWCHANQPSIMLSFLGLQFDIASGSAVGSGSASTFQRVDRAGDVFEAHNLPLSAGGRVAVRRSAVMGSMVDTLSRGLGQANVLARSCFAIVFRLQGLRLSKQSA
jgi:hypothetical protein